MWQGRHRPCKAEAALPHRSHGEKKTVTFRRVACKQNGNDFNERRSTMAIDINNANYKLFTDFAAAAAKQTPS